MNFQELSATVLRLERDYLRFDREASRLDDKGQIAGYREMIRNKVMEVKDGYRECKVLSFSLFFCSFSFFLN